MRILVLSDITWGYHTRRLLRETVLQSHPSLVLVAGDIVNNKIGDFETYWRHALDFFSYLSKNRIPACYVQGNWDRSPEYDKFVRRKIPRIQNASCRTVTASGLRILGVPHCATNDLQFARALSRALPDNVDIVLAHAEKIRRAWLFHLPAQAVITGHFSEQVAAVRGRLFVSTWAFPAHYVVLDWGQSEIVVHYHYDYASPPQQPRVAAFSNGLLAWRSRSFPNSGEYGHQLEDLLRARELLAEGRAQRTELDAHLRSLGIPSSHIQEYLAEALADGRAP
jgi:predicted phosphodiesterase